MSPFVAIAWRAGNRAAPALVAGYAAERGLGDIHVAECGPWRLAVLPGAGAGRPDVVRGRPGVVIGRAYHKDTLEALEPAAFAAWGEAARDGEEPAARFAADFWGPCVAFLAWNGDLTVYRDPGGALPCVRVDGPDGLMVVASRVEDALWFLGEPPAIDWSRLALFCANPFAPEIDGLVEGIRPLRPGCVASLGARGAQPRRAWDPARLARERAIIDPQEASAAIKEALRLAVGEPLSVCAKTVLLLSGGIDSSTLAACLSEIAPAEAVSCFNVMSAPDAGDERAYARAVCERFGFALEEVALDDSLAYFAPMTRPGLTSAPTLGCLGNWQRDLVLAQAESHNARVLMSGEGGDAVFGGIAKAIVAADWLWRPGTGAESFFGACLHAAQLSGVSAWRAAGAALDAEVKRRFGVEWRDANTEEAPRNILLAPDAARAVASRKPQASVWGDPRGLPAAKNYHISSTIALVGRVTEYLLASGHPGEQEPLLTQPVMEACFRAPVSVLTPDGWERGLVRRLYADRLPREIVMRRAKGDPTTGLNAVMQKQRAWLRERLADGALVAQGLVDREFLLTALEPAFATRDHGGRLESNLLTLVAAEQWASQWRDRAAAIGATRSAA